MINNSEKSNSSCKNKIYLRSWLKFASFNVCVQVLISSVGQIQTIAWGRASKCEGKLTGGKGLLPNPSDKWGRLLSLCIDLKLLVQSLGGLLIPRRWSSSGHCTLLQVHISFSTQHPGWRVSQTCLV